MLCVRPSAGYLKITRMHFPFSMLILIYDGAMNYNAGSYYCMDHYLHVVFELRTFADGVTGGIQVRIRCGFILQYFRLLIMSLEWKYYADLTKYTNTYTYIL